MESYRRGWVFKKRSPKVVPLKLSHCNAGLCAGSESHLTVIKMLHCRSKKGIAIPYFRAHSEITVIKKRVIFWFLFMPNPSGTIFNPRAIGGFL
jgi:hypothetical protein